MYTCAKCGKIGCMDGDLTKTLKACPSLDREMQDELVKLYEYEENLKIAHNAALVEAEGIWYFDKNRGNTSVYKQDGI